MCVVVGDSCVPSNTENVGDVVFGWILRSASVEGSLIGFVLFFIDTATTAIYT